MSLKEDLRLETLERRENGGVTAADLGKRLARLAPAVTEINGRIAAANALLPDNAAPIPPIAWRPNPNSKRILRAPKWRLGHLDWLIYDARSSVWLLEPKLESLLRQLGPDGPGVDATELDLTLREIRLDIRDVDAKGKEIDSRPKFNDWFLHYSIWMLAAAFTFAAASAMLLILSRTG